MTREELTEKKQVGDLLVVAKMLEITPHNALKIWQRPKSRRYPELAEALEIVIKAREELINHHSGNHSK